MNVSIELCLALVGFTASLSATPAPSATQARDAGAAHALVAAAGGARGAKPTPSSRRPANDVVEVEWMVDLDAALEHARSSGKLVLVCFNMDGEQANERALAMYRSAQFGKAVDQVVCVLCSADQHGEGPAVCSRFGCCSCRDHVASEKRARQHFFGDLRDNVAPQHILLYPDGLVAWHAIYEVDPAELTRAITGAHKNKSQPLAQRVRNQRSQLSSLRARATKGVTEALLQVRAILARTPAEHFLDALVVLEKDLGAKMLDALASHPRAQALPLLQAAQQHTNKALRQLAATLASRVAAQPVAASAPAAPAVEIKPLAELLPVLGPGQELDRVHWLGAAQTLAGQRDRITLVWLFRLDAQDLVAQAAEMNEFARQVAGQGIGVLGLACDLRPSEASERLAALRCDFPVGAYAPALRPFAVERFPSWVVLDPSTDIVYRSPQDGASFDWLQARDLARQMAATPSYRARLTQGN